MSLTVDWQLDWDSLAYDIGGKRLFRLTYEEQKSNVVMQQ